MKTLRISKGGLSLAEHLLAVPVVTIGRSPVCDVILRAQGVSPVHFLLEWVGVGAFDKDKGRWLIFDIAHHDDTPDQKASGFGGNMGSVVGEKGIEIGGFQFSIQDDPLAMTQLSGGILHERVTHLAQASSTEEIGEHARLLEVIKIHSREQTVVDVAHHIVTGKSDGVIPSIPELKIQWSLGQVSKILWDKSKPIKTFSRGIPVEARTDENGPTSEVDFRDQDFLSFNLPEFDVYLRFVEAIRLKKAEHDLFKNIWVRWGAIAVLLTLIFIYIVLSIPAFVKPVEIPEPPRIARIEVVDVKPEETPIVKEQKSPIPKPTPEESAKGTSQTVAKAKEGAMGKARAKTHENAKVSQPGLNTPVPQGKSNNVGLLGMMKSGGSGKSKGSVSADMILNNGVVSKTVSGDEGGIVVNKPPAGVIDLNAKTTKKAGSGSELGAAATTLKAGDSYDVKSASPIAGKGGKATFSVNTGAGQDNSVLGGASNVATDIGGKEGFTAKGGLDKEAVRLTLIKYRRQIRTCYEKALLTNPRVGGRIVFQWYISSKGPVTSVVLKSSEAKMPSFEGCVEAVIKSIMFPAAPNGQSTIVIYPFVFQKT